MTQLPAFLAWALGDALTYELVLLVLWCLVLILRRRLLPPD